MLNIKKVHVPYGPGNIVYFVIFLFYCFSLLDLQYVLKRDKSLKGTKRDKKKSSKLSKTRNMTLSKIRLNVEISSNLPLEFQ